MFKYLVNPLRSDSCTVRMFLAKLTALIIGNLIFISLLSANNQHTLEFEQMTIKDGLSQSTVNCIYQDSKGFIWIGTQDGLNRYDGYNFKIYRHDPDDSTSLTSNYINTICEDSQGRLWIGTEGTGIEIFDPRLEQFINYQNIPSDPSSLSDNFIYSIIESTDETIWIATSESLEKYHPETNGFTRYERSKRDSTDHWTYYLLKIVEGRDGFIWTCTYDGLSWFDPVQEQFNHYVLNKSDSGNLINEEINTILLDDDLVWLGTNGGLVKLELNSGSSTVYSHEPNNSQSLVDNEITSIAKDNSGFLWVGTYKGLDRLDPAKGQFLHFSADYNNSKSISENSIMSIYQDFTDIIWIGTSANGLNKYDPGKRKFTHHFRQHDNPNSLPNNYIGGIFEDHSGSIWLGTGGGGLSNFDPVNHNYRNFTHDPDNFNSIADNDVGAINEDNNGRLWIGFTDGLDRYDPRLNTFQHFAVDEADSSTTGLYMIYSICHDPLGTMWFGSYGGGLSKYDPKQDQFIHYYHKKQDTTSLSNDYINVLYCDPSGDLWIGTDNGGLNRFDRDSDQFIKYTVAENKFSIYSIHNDQRGKLWLGVHGGGLLEYDIESNQLVTYTTKNGLPNNVVYSILEDENRNLWLATNSGLSKFNPERNIFQNYDYRDGLQSNEFNQGAAIKSKSGILYFGGIHGFNSFHPADITDNPHIPNIFLTDFNLFNQRIKPGPGTLLDQSILEIKEINLSYRQNAFSIFYSALNFSIPEKNKYKYILVGFDKDWVEAGNSRVANYMNLKPGSYTFRVTGSNNDGIWNETGASVKIHIEPPFWQTTIFRVFGFIFVFGSLFYLINRRITSIERQKQTLEQIVTQRTKELEQANQSLNQEIFEREQIDQALQENVDLLVKSQRVARLGSYALDAPADTWTSSEILDEIFGIDEQYPRNIASWVQLIHPDHQEEMLSYFQIEVLENHQSFNREYPIIRHNDQEERWLHGLGELVFDENGNVKSMIGTIQDITDRHKLEEQLRHSQKLEAITKLTGGIAHDFNNILGSIFGAVDLLLTHIGKEHPGRRYVDLILDKGQNAAELVRRMLAYSRQQLLRPEPVNLNLIIEDISVLLKRALEVKITLDLELAAGLNQINGDRTAIDQIIMNLCLNAIESMADGGKLTVKTENRQITANSTGFDSSVRPGDYVSLKVIDTGHGISTEDIDKIFEPFYTTREVGKGTGLGLSMVFGLVKQHKGYIQCSSKPNEQTIFEVIFPVLVDFDVVTSDQKFEEKIIKGSGLILVVEDDADLANILEEQLKEIGYEVIITNNGEEALSIYKKIGSDISLVISDIIMPKLGGKELYEKLKQIDPDLKFIFTSGYASDGVFKKYDIDVEMILIKKPFRIDEISAVVNLMINR